MGVQIDERHSKYWNHGNGTLSQDDRMRANESGRNEENAGILRQDESGRIGTDQEVPSLDFTQESQRGTFIEHQGYLDGDPYRPKSERLTDAERLAVIEAYNEHSETRANDVGAIEDSEDVYAKSRAFQALAIREGWIFHRDAAGEKYFWIRNPDGASFNVRVSDHANVNRAYHFKETDINIAPDDGRYAVDTFASALWKMRNASINEDGDTLIDGAEPVRFSKGDYLTDEDIAAAKSPDKWFDPLLERAETFFKGSDKFGALDKSIHTQMHKGLKNRYQISARAFCCSRSKRATSRSTGRMPPLNPRMAEATLPSAVRGPVDCSHGFQRRINSARSARCSGVLM
jgi:hypothetical protein